LFIKQYSHNLSAQGLGIDFNILGAADRKSDARTYSMHNHGEHLGHLFFDNQAFIDGFGQCAKHCNPRTKETCQIDSTRPDLVIGGLPCQALTGFRQRSGRTSKTGPAATHPAIEWIASGFKRYLLARKPFGWVVEEVDEIATEMHPETCQTWLQYFASEMSSLGYSVRAIKLDHSMFARMARSRTFIIGVSEELGGSAAADFIMQSLQDSGLVRVYSIIPLGPPRLVTNRDPLCDSGVARLPLALMRPPWQELKALLLSTHVPAAVIPEIVDLDRSDERARAATQVEALSRVAACSHV